MTSECDLTCDVCGESFKTKDALGGHKGGHTRRTSDAQLLAEMDRLVDELGRSPTITEMDVVGAYSADTYKERFDSWAKALHTAGYEPIKQHGISEDAILSEITRLAEEIGDPPTASEMRSKGKFTVTTAQNRFGSWNQALEAAGYDPNNRYRISDEELLEEVHRLVDELGKVPTAQEMGDHGEFSHRPYFKRWDGWQAAIRSAGYEPVGRPSGPDNCNWKEEPVSEWREYGDNWDQQRQKALERDDYICQTPGCELTQEAHREEFTRGLHVHHIRPLSAFGDDENEVNFERANRLDNLVTVCVEDHYLWERASPLRLDTR